MDPASLVGKQVATFTLSMTGTGTVQAVDATPIEAIAEERLASSISDGYELVPGSISVAWGRGASSTASSRSRWTARRSRSSRSIAAVLERMVLGLPKAEAEAVLAPYGDVVIVLSPGYVTNVPTMDARVTLVINDAVDSGPAEATPGPSPTPTATPSESPLEVAPIAVRDLVPARGVALGHGSERAGTIRLMFRTPTAPFDRARRTLRRHRRRAA